MERISWTHNLELYLKEVGEHSLCLGMLHKNCERKFSSKALCIDLPVIVISTLCGSLTLSAKSMFGADLEDTALKIVGAFSLFSGILGTIQAYFSYGRRAENHRNSYLEYTKLYRFVKVELGLPRISRIQPKDLLKLINDQFERLNELSPAVPDSILKEFSKKYKDTTIDKPPELNGLDEICIYAASEDDSVRLGRIPGKQHLSSNLVSLLTEAEKEEKIERETNLTREGYLPQIISSANPVSNKVEKVEEVKIDVSEKVEDVKIDVSEKVEEVKIDVSEKVEEVKKTDITI